VSSRISFLIQVFCVFYFFGAQRQHNDYRRSCFTLQVLTRASFEGFSFQSGLDRLGQCTETRHGSQIFFFLKNVKRSYGTKNRKCIFLLAMTCPFGTFWVPVVKTVKLIVPVGRFLGSQLYNWRLRSVRNVWLSSGNNLFVRGSCFHELLLGNGTETRRSCRNQNKINLIGRMPIFHWQEREQDGTRP